MRMIALAALALLLSGCAQSEGASTRGGDGASVSLDGTSDDAGDIDGIVVDDAQAPLEGTLVGIAALKIQVATDAGGKFHFGNLPAGSQQVDAVKLGFEGASKRVDVQAGQTTSVILTLRPLAVQTPYQETFGPFNGYFSCFVGTPVGITACTGDRITGVDANSVLFPGDRRAMAFNLSSDDWATMVGEARWSQGAFATGVGMAIYPSYAKRAGSHWWCEATGRSPLLYRYEAADVKLGDGENDGLSKCTSQGAIAPAPAMSINPLLLVADPGFGGVTTDNPPVRFMLQQRYELLQTMFYMEPGPADYSGFADR